MRFYVKKLDHGIWKRGVVFIKEIVPLPTISWTANVLYREPYCTLPMKHTSIKIGRALQVSYSWKFQGQWNKLGVIATNLTKPLLETSEAAFITEHYWGYTKWNEHKTAEYQVEHPTWRMHEVDDYIITCDIAALYGHVFAEYTQKPSSVLLAEGSEIVVRKGKFINK